MEAVRDTSPVTCIVADAVGEPIKGTFYGPELQKFTPPDYFDMESILDTRQRGNVTEYLATVRPKKYAHGLCCVLAERRSGLQRFAVYGSRVGLCSPVCQRHLVASGDTNNAPGVRFTHSRFLRLVILLAICFRII